MPRRSLSDATLRKLAPRKAPYPDPELPGHYFYVGKRKLTGIVSAREPSGKQKWEQASDLSMVTIEAARDLARARLKQVKTGQPDDTPETFAEVVVSHHRRHVLAKGLRCSSEHQRLIERHFLPRWADRDFRSIRRSDLVRLMDEVEDNHSARQADACYAIFSAIANWYASRHDDYQPPLARGMRRLDPKSRKRTRILDDGEIRIVWKAADAAGSFGAIIQFALLTAQRREKVCTLKWEDVSEDGTWIIATEEREKGNPGALKLPEMALAVIRAQPRFASNPYVFAGRLDSHFSGFGKSKARFDRKTNLAPWVLHDLRRTARSLMARAGIADRVAEQVLGHAITGIEGVYNQHRYLDEKADALRRLAALVERILDPQPNVIQLAAAAS